MSQLTYTDTSVETLRKYVEVLGEPEWMYDLRMVALERAGRMEWPTSEDEEFRRSDVSSYRFDQLAFESAGEESPGDQPSPELSGRLDFAGTSTVRASLADGLADKGVILASFKAAFAGAVPETVLSQVKSVLTEGLRNADNRIAVTHYAAITHGAILYVPRFLELKEPFLVTEDEDEAGGLLRVPHLVVIADEGARATVIRRLRGTGEVLVNDASDVRVGDAGAVRLFAVQDLSIDSSYFEMSRGAVGRDATLEHYAAYFGAAFSKSRIDVNMVGRGGDAFLGGIYFATGSQHFDMRTVQRHIEPNAHSDTLYRGAVNDAGRSVYQGLIRVYQEAVQTDAYLTNNTLVLSREARADSIPTLEINTDDVRCSHGSTAGKLDPLQLHYLRTRGFSAEEARKMLVAGFFEAILSRYPDVLLSEIHGILERRIATEG